VACRGANPHCSKFLQVFDFSRIVVWHPFLLSFRFCQRKRTRSQSAILLRLQTTRVPFSAPAFFPSLFRCHEFLFFPDLSVCRPDPGPFSTIQGVFPSLCLYKARGNTPHEELVFLFPHRHPPLPRLITVSLVHSSSKLCCS